VYCASVVGVERIARVVVATSALGAGIDLPDVRLVVHIGRPTMECERRVREESASIDCVLGRASAVRTAV
jgi:hypothetical protein